MLSLLLLSKEWYEYGKSAVCSAARFSDSRKWPCVCVPGGLRLRRSAFRPGTHCLPALWVGGWVGGVGVRPTQAISQKTTGTAAAITHNTATLAQTWWLETHGSHDARLSASLWPGAGAFRRCTPQVARTRWQNCRVQTQSSLVEVREQDGWKLSQSLFTKLSDYFSQITSFWLSSSTWVTRRAAGFEEEGLVKTLIWCSQISEPKVFSLLMFLWCHSVFVHGIKCESCR